MSLPNDPAVPPPSAPSVSVPARSSDPSAVQTLGGAMIVLALGILLGIVHNAFGLASKPSHGLAWVAEPDSALPMLEELDHGHPHGADSAVAIAPATAAPESAAPHASSPAAPTPSPAATTPASGSPASDPSATTTAPPAPVAASLPVIPDVPGPIGVEFSSFKRLYDANAVLVVDAREAEEYQAGHIAGAINLPYNDALAEPERAKTLSHGGRPIVVYCSSAACHLAKDLAGFLVESGQRRVLVYEGGWKDWSDGNHPSAKGDAPGRKP